MRVLALADRIYASSLADEASHCRVFVPDVTELNFGNLTQCVVLAGVLSETKQREFANKFARHGGTQDVERKLGRRRGRADDAEPLCLVHHPVEILLLFCHPISLPHYGIRALRRTLRRCPRRTARISVVLSLA